MDHLEDTEINLMHENKHEEDDEQWRNKNLEKLNTNKNLFIDICQSPSIFIFLIVIAILPILQILIGWRYSGACSINQLIPHYLIVAGIVGLLLVLLISLTQFIMRTFGRQMFDDTVDRTNPNRASMLVGCGICSIMCINLSLLIFLLGWSIAGLIWVIEVWQRVQFHHTESNDYCHPILYQFTFSLLLITATFKIIFFFFVCKKTCIKVRSTRRKDTVTSENL